jgi:glycosyltransferase involved in cell wall biosynthesis
MNTPSISVVIPAFNATATLPRALDSVFRQTCTDFEVLVVDDGSSDDTEAALAAYGRPVRLIRQPNQGAAAARNHGIREARGRLIAFLDADDFWHSRKLELQRQAFEAHPRIKLCWTDHGYWNTGQPLPDLDTVDTSLAVPRVSEDFNAIFLDPYLGTPGVMMLRERLLELGGFRDDLDTAEDVDLWLRATHGQPVAHIPQDLFFVVRTPNSLTGRAQNTFRDNLRVIDDFCAAHPDFLAHNGSVVRQSRARVLEEWGSSVLTDRNYRMAEQILRQALGNRFGWRAAYLWFKAKKGALASPRETT